MPRAPCSRSAREEIRAGFEPGDLRRRVEAEIAVGARAPAAAGAERDRRRHPYESGPRAARRARRSSGSREVGRGYSNLEYDVTAGSRGSRQDHVAGLLRRLTGAEAALVVNNNAAAVLLALAALAEGREVVVSRGELIEIGDGFRIPDVLSRSGARLVEVGTTNRTRAADYEAAVGPETALLLRVHQSNFRLVGIYRAADGRGAVPGRAAPRNPARRRPRVGRAGDVPDEPSVRESLDAGADLVCFSGDKLLGGPQAGIVVGRAELVERLRRHPLQRALRADKLTLAALEGTLGLYLRPGAGAAGGAGAPDAPRARCRRSRASRAAGRARGRNGGGDRRPCRWRRASAHGAAELRVCGRGSVGRPAPRQATPPVVAIVRDGRLLLDCRTLTDAEVDEVAEAVRSCRSR